MRILLIIFLGVMAGAAPPKQGTMDIGGGAASVCRALPRSNAITNAEMIDLLEAKHRYKMSIPNQGENFDQQALNAISRLDFMYADMERPGINLKRYLLEFQKRFAAAPKSPKGIALSRPTDLGKEISLIERPGCFIEAIGYREVINGEPVMMLNLEAFSALNQTHRAAFFVHETLYAFFQVKLKQQVSDRKGTIQIRKLVGTLFSSSAGLNEISQSVNFLSLIEQGRVFVDSSMRTSRVEFRYNKHFLSDENDELSEKDEDSFLCHRRDGSSIHSKYLDGTLGFEPNLNCDYFTISKHIGNVWVDGKNVLEILSDSRFKIDFLKDRSDYVHLNELVRYQPKKKN